MDKDQYTEKDIKALSDFEHIRLRPGMYIGTTENPTHLIYEIIDNALDESSGGYASVIGLQIDDKDHEVCIADNGRGIPFENNTVELITTKLFSGGKFDKGKNKAYGVASGLHGVGIVAVNALSDWMTVEICRDGKLAIFKFVEGILKDKKITDFTGQKHFSTQITFKPSKKYFSSLIFDVTALKNRLMLASIHINHLRLMLVHNDKKEIIDCRINDYLKEKLQDEGKEYTQFVKIDHKIDDEEVNMIFCFCMGGKVTPKCLGSVNLLAVNTGSHINISQEVIRDVLFEFVQKEKRKLDKYDCLTGLRCYTSISLYEPQYSSQTKEKLTNNKKDFVKFTEQLKIKLKDFFVRNVVLKDQILNYIESYKRKLDASANIRKSDSGVTRFNLNSDSKLRNCSSRTVSRCELFIVEGQSASGSLVQCRDPKYHAIMPLQGKIPNVCNSSKEYFKNKEIVELINAIGTGIEDDFDINKIQYDKIIISTDADADGSHIATLLIVLFLKIMPNLLKANKIFIAKVPLYGAMLQNEFIPLWTDDDLNKFKEKHSKTKIQRYKGLGEMNPNQLKEVLLNNSKRNLICVNYPENIIEKNYIFDLMTKAELKRKIV